MKISCQSCQAKYTIADEKVVGKVVKIRCKKCGATIVVNGNDPDAAAATGGEAGAMGGDEQWTVNVAEGDQRTMTVGEVIREYKSGVVNDDTYCWKDGMNDWLPLREIQELYSACTIGSPPIPDANDGYTPLSLGVQPPSETGGAGAGFGLFGGANGSEHTDVNNGTAAALFSGSSTGTSPSAGAISTSTAAARRQGGRQTGNADLFGGAAQAGGENDVMTSAAGPSSADPASKMTGARNENSVLFSLSALTSDPSPGGGAAKKNETTAQGDGSGLIDIRALANSMGVDNNAKNPNAKVDDIMNLSGGGAFSAALAAPVLAPPSADNSGMQSYAPGGEEKKSNKTMLIGLIAGGGILGICILAAAIIFSSGKKDDKDETKAAPTSTETTPSSTATQAAAPTATDTGSGTTAAPPSTGAAGGSEKTASGGKPSGGKPSGGGEKSSAGSGGGETKPAAAAEGPKEPAKPKSLAEAMVGATGGQAAPEKKAEPQGGAAPFDRGAALAALSGVAVQACKKPDGPTGGGKVRVTFEPNGSVSKVEFSEGPFSGTPVGGCILGKFRGARVPAFSGQAVTAAKSFVVN